MAMFFDEICHLAVVGSGFLRTPFLHATNVPADRPAPGDCPGLGGSIIHVPAAMRRSTLNAHQPPFRRVVLTSALTSIVSQDQAAQANHEGAGVAYRFHQEPHRNLCRAFTNAATNLFGQQALILDQHPDKPILNGPLGVNGLGTSLGNEGMMPTGFLAFISRYWEDQRHLDHDLMLSHRIPLHFDTDWNIMFRQQVSVATTFMVPIVGNAGDVKVWDARLGASSYDVMGSPILGLSGPTDTSGGTVQVLVDANGALYLSGAISGTPGSSVPIVISDDTGQVYSRSISIFDGYPTPPDFTLPNARVGTPYTANLPVESATFTITGSKLPPGVTISGSTVSGTPTIYGGNYYVTAEVIDLTGDQNIITFHLAVNRAPRELLRLLDTEGNDYHTGEYYAIQFMPYGSVLAYGGMAWEFRRARATSDHYPYVHEQPYVYGHSSRRGALDAEEVWRGTGAVS